MGFHSLNTPSLFPYQDLCPLFFPLDCDALLLFSHCHVWLIVCPWGFPGKKTGEGSHFLLCGIFQTQWLNLLETGFFTTEPVMLSPKYEHDAPLNPFMFQLKCHPFVNPLSNSVFPSWESDSSTLHAARMKADILPAVALLRHFVRLSLASLLPSCDLEFNCGKA